MLKIRLQRVGRKNDPSFRVIVAESRKDSQSGKFIEVLGAYNARHGKPEFKADRVKHWIGVGAQVSPTVHNLLVDQKVIDKKKVSAMPKRKAVVKDGKAGEKKEVKTEEKKEEVIDAPAA